MSFYGHFAAPHSCAMLTKSFHLTQVCIIPFSNIQRGKGYYPHVNKKSIEVGQRFSPETASNVHKKEFRIPNIIPDYKK